MIAILWLGLIAFICLAGLSVLSLVRLSGKKNKLSFYHKHALLGTWDFRPKFHLLRIIFIIWIEFSAVGAFLYWAYAPPDTPNYDATLAVGLTSVAFFALWAGVVFPCYWGWRDMGILLAFMGLLLSIGTAISATVEASTENDVRLWIAMGFFWVFVIGWIVPIMISVQHKWSNIRKNLHHASHRDCGQSMHYEWGHKLFVLVYSENNVQYKDIMY